jgi:hypothetical protein
MALAVLVAKAFFFSIYTTSFHLIIQEVSRKSFTLYQQFDFPYSRMVGAIGNREKGNREKGNWQSEKSWRFKSLEAHHQLPITNYPSLITITLNVPHLSEKGYSCSYQSKIECGNMLPISRF